MKVVFFSIRPDELAELEPLLPAEWRVRFSSCPLDETSVDETAGADVVSLFVCDVADGAMLERLAQRGVKMLALRSAGFDHVDIAAARRLGLTVARAPAYSPHAVADHALALLLALNRGIHLARDKLRLGDFSLRGQMGFDLNGKTAGIIGLGRIGRLVARRLEAFGCRVLGSDPYCKDAPVEMLELDELLAMSDIISLNCPLTEKTRHLLDAERFALMKPGALLVNTARGAVVDTLAMLDALLSGRLGGAALDVYEFEHGLFFTDHRDEGIRDPLLARLLSLPNVVFTGHQAFYTREAVRNIVTTTTENIRAWREGRRLEENWLT